MKKYVSNIAIILCLFCFHSSLSLADAFDDLDAAADNMNSDLPDRSSDMSAKQRAEFEAWLKSRNGGKTSNSAPTVRKSTSVQPLADRAPKNVDSDVQRGDAYYKESNSQKMSGLTLTPDNCPDGFDFSQYSQKRELAKTLCRAKLAKGQSRRTANNYQSEGCNSKGLCSRTICKSGNCKLCLFRIEENTKTICSKEFSPREGDDYWWQITPAIYFSGFDVINLEPEGFDVNQFNSKYKNRICSSEPSQPVKNPVLSRNEVGCSDGYATGYDSKSATRVH